MSHAPYHGLILLYTLIIASSFPIGAIITQEVDSLWLTWVRFALATLLFFPLLFFRQSPPKLPSLRDWGRYFLVGGAYSLYFIAMFEALKHTSSLNTGALYTTVPFLSAALTWAILGQKTSARRFALMSIALLLVLWVIFRGSWELLKSFELSAGDGVFIGGCLTMAAYIPLSKRLYRGEGVKNFTFWTLLASTLILTLFALPQIFTLSPPSIRPALWGWIAYLAFFSTCVTFFITQITARFLSPVEILSYTYLTPGFIVILDWLFKGMIPSYSTLLAIFALGGFVYWIGRLKE